MTPRAPRLDRRSALAARLRVELLGTEVRSQDNSLPILRHHGAPPRWRRIGRELSWLSVSARELRRSETEHRFGEEEEERPGVGRRVSGTQEQTGYTGRSRRVHQELRDQKVAVFVDRLPEGVWGLRYDLRAEVPGRFHALPLIGHAMYVPEIRGNSAELRLVVRDRAGASD